MGLKLKNNAGSSLAASMSASETMVRVMAGHGVRFPSLAAGDWFPLAIQNVQGDIEYMRVTARAGDVMTVTREQEGTQAIIFDAGDVVFLPLTVNALKALGVIDGDVAVSIGDATVTG